MKISQMGVLASVLRALQFDVCIDDLDKDIDDRKWLELQFKKTIRTSWRQC